MASPWLLADQQRRRAAQAEELARLTNSTGYVGGDGQPVLGPGEQGISIKVTTPPTIEKPEDFTPRPDMGSAELYDLQRRKEQASLPPEKQQGAPIGALGGAAMHLAGEMAEPVSGAISMARGLYGDKKAVEAGKESMPLFFESKQQQFKQARPEQASELSMERTGNALSRAFDPDVPWYERVLQIPNAIQASAELWGGPSEVASAGKLITRPTNAMARKVHQAILSRAKEAGRGETLFSLGDLSSEAARKINTLRAKLPDASPEEYAKIKADIGMLRREAMAEGKAAGEARTMDVAAQNELERSRMGLDPVEKQVMEIRPLEDAAESLTRNTEKSRVNGKWKKLPKKVDPFSEEAAAIMEGNSGYIQAQVNDYIARGMWKTDDMERVEGWVDDLVSHYSHVGDVDNEVVTKAQEALDRYRMAKAGRKRKMMSDKEQFDPFKDIEPEPVPSVAEEYSKAEYARREAEFSAQRAAREQAIEGQFEPTVETVPREPAISPETKAEFKAAAEQVENPEYADKVLAKAEEMAPDKIAGQIPAPSAGMPRPNYNPSGGMPRFPSEPPAGVLAGDPPRRGPAPVGGYAEHTGTREPVPEVPLMGAGPVKPGWFRRTRSGVAFLKNLVGKALSSTNILEDAVRQRIPEHIPVKVAAEARIAAPEFRQRILGVGTESAATSDPQVGKLTQWRDALPDKDAAALTAMQQPEGRNYRVSAWSADNQHIASLPADLKAKIAPIDEWIDASGKAQAEAGLAQRVMVEKPDKAMQALMEADPEAAQALAEEVGARYVAAPQPFRPSHRAPRVTDPTLAETERLNPQGDVARAKWKAVEEINWDNDPRYNPDLLPEEVRPQGKELTDARRKGRAKLRAKIKAAIGEAQTRLSSAAESMSPLEFERDFYFWPDQFLYKGQWHDATVWRLAKKGGKELSYLEAAPQRVAHRIAMDKAFGQDLGVLDKELTEQYLTANATAPNIRHEGGNVYNDYLDVFQKAGMDSTDFDRVIAAMEHRPRTLKGDPTGYMAGILDRARIASTSNAQAAQTAQEFGKDLFALVAHRVTGVGSSIGNLWQGIMAGTGMLSKAGRSPLRVFSDAIKAIPEAAKAEELMGRGLSVNTLERGIGDVETATNTYVKTGSLEKIKQVADRVTLRRYFQRIGQQRSLRQAKGRFEGLELLAKKGQLGTQEEALRRTFGLPDTWIQAMEELPKLEGTPEYLITKTELEDRFIAANVRQTQLIGQHPYMKRRAQLGAFGEQIASFAGPTLQNFSRWQEAVQQLWRSGGTNGWRRVGAKAAGASLGAVGFEITREVFNAAYNMIANSDSQSMKPGTAEWTQRVFTKMLFDLGALGGMTDVIEQYSSHRRGTIGDTVRGLGTPTALEFAGQAADSLSHSQKVGLVENVIKKAMIPYIVGKDVAGVGSWAVVLSGLIGKAAQKAKQDEKAKAEDKSTPKQTIAPSPIDLKLEELFNNEDIDAKLERVFGEQDIDAKLLELMK